MSQPTATIDNDHFTYTLSSLFSSPKASAAAVGSLITRRTFNPEIFPASLVACNIT